MTLFIVFAVLMTLLALAILLRGMLSPSQTSQVDRHQLNIDVFKDRLAELASQGDNPVSGQDAPSDQPALAKELLDKTPEYAPPHPQAALYGRFGAMVVAMLLPTMAILLYLLLGSPESLNNRPNAAEEGAHTSTITPEKLNEMIKQLQQRLDQSPDDLEGWYLLARSFTSLDRFQEAKQAYETLIKKQSAEDPDVWIDYAEVLGLLANEDYTGEAYAWLQKAIKLAPDHEKGLWLIGIAAFQSHHYQEAIQHWQHLAALQPANSPGLSTLEKMIAQARQKEADKKELPESTRAMEPPTSTDMELAVKIDFKPPLQTNISPEDNVWIIYRRASEPDEPIATLKQQVKDLPLLLELPVERDPKQRQDGNLELLELFAWVKHSEDNPSSVPGSGDWIGYSGPIDPITTGQMTLIVDTKIP